MGAVAGGYLNCARGSCSFTGGGYSNDAYGAFSAVAGGYNNTACGACSTIGGGRSHFIHSCQKNAVIGGGSGNCITYHSGYTPAASNDGNFIPSGRLNCICICTTSGNYNTLGGGQNNKIFANVANSTIAGGAQNTICNTTGFDYGSFIGGGAFNYIINGDDSVIVGGSANCIDANDNNFIGGGCFNTGSANFGVIVGGCKNYITTAGSCSAILAGICNTSCAANTYLLGSNIVTDMPDATYVQQVSYTGHTLGTAEFAGEVAAGLGSYASLSDGDLVYLNSSGQWNLTDADAASSSTGLIGIYLSSPGRVLLRGHARVTANSSFTGMTTIGAPLYVSTTAGDFTQTAPSATGDIVRIIGYVTDTTNDIMYFCPDTTWVEIV